MVQFTFDSMFRTTNKGLPDTQNLTPYTYLSMNHFVYSLIIQIIIGLVVTGYTGISIYRAFYKIKNKKFFPTSSGQQKPQPDQETKFKSDAQGEENTNDNLIYRFDQDDEKEKKEEEEKEEDEEEEKEEKEEEKEEDEEEEQDNEDQEEIVSQETTQWFLDLDHKMLYFQSFLIPFAVVVNMFATNILAVILLAISLVLFFLFNIKQMCSKTPVLQLLFTLPCIAVMLMVYFEDRDMST